MGSRLANSLEEQGLIEREQTIHNGQRTYLLTPTGEEPPDASQASSQRDAAQPEISPDDELATREERALTLIRENGGRYQSDLWKAMDVSSRTGSRITTNLEDKTEIRRVETTYNHRRTYFLSPMPRDLTSRS